MPYLEISDFKAGLDTRRMRVTADPGTLVQLDNAHITRGGEVQKRLAWERWKNLPEGTFGLAEINDTIYVFGSAAAPAGIPSGVTYQRLEPGGGEAMTAFNSADAFNDVLYVSAAYDDGDDYHFEDGTVVDFDPDTLGFNAGKFVRTIKSKMYSVAGSSMYYSAINDPSDMTSASSAGFVNMGSQAAGSQQLVALAPYGQFTAVFAEKTIQIWSLDSDPSNNAQIQVLPNVGTIAPGSVVSFGDIDVFFLSQSGIRSVKARDSSNAAFASDIGTAIDDLIIDLLHTEDCGCARAALDPHEGRYMLFIGETTFVFSYFPLSKISAWSQYDLPGEVDAVVVTTDNTIIRVGDTLYRYGGENHSTYDDTAVVAVTPFMDAGKPATAKMLTGVDLAAEGTWKIEIAVDPENPDHFDDVATVTGSTFRLQKIPLEVDATHWAFRLTSSGDGAARFGKIITHYEEIDAG